MAKSRAKKLKPTPMEELTKGYEKFMKDKEQSKRGKQTFDRILKKATKTKQRGSK